MTGNKNVICEPVIREKSTPKDICAVLLRTISNISSLTTNQMSVISSDFKPLLRDVWINWHIDVFTV